MTESMLATLFEKLGIAGLLLAAVWIVAKKLATTYEARIAALEAASARCEEDRTNLRDLFIQHVTGTKAKTDPT